MTRRSDSSGTDVRFWIALTFAIWFVPAGSFWVYLINVVIGLPFGLVATALWFFGRKTTQDVNRYRWLGRVLVLGWGLSAVSFLVLFLSN